MPAEQFPRPQAEAPKHNWDAPITEWSDEMIAGHITSTEAEIARIEEGLQQPLDTSGDIAYQNEHATDPTIAHEQSAQGRDDYVRYTHLSHLKHLLTQAIAERDRRDGLPEGKAA